MFCPQGGTWAAESARLAQEAARSWLPRGGLWVACPLPIACKTLAAEAALRDGCGWRLGDL